jgi:hypothetical protein
MPTELMFVEIIVAKTSPDVAMHPTAGRNGYPRLAA